MVTILKNLFHRPVIRFGMARDTRGRFRDPCFASFISGSNRKTINTGFRDARLAARRLLRYAIVAGAVSGGAWILFESAHALAAF